MGTGPSGRARSLAACPQCVGRAGRCTGPVSGQSDRASSAGTPRPPHPCLTAYLPGSERWTRAPIIRTTFLEAPGLSLLGPDHWCEGQDREAIFQATPHHSSPLSSPPICGPLPTAIRARRRSELTEQTSAPIFQTPHHHRLTPLSKPSPCAPPANRPPAGKFAPGPAQRRCAGRAWPPRRRARGCRSGRRLPVRSCPPGCRFSAYCAFMSDQKIYLEQPTRDLRLMTNPGLAVPIAGTGFGLIGDGLAQALRPRG
jgi:hypothetical protein